MLKQHWAIIKAKAEPMAGGHLLYLHCPTLAASATPGQFVMVRSSPAIDPYLRYPLAIHRLQADGFVLMVPADESVAWLAQRQVGAEVDVLGPGGRALDVQRIQHTALLAQGIGVAPLVCIADRTRGPVTLLLQAASAGQVYPRELLPKTVEYQPFVGRAEDDAWQLALASLAGWAQVIYAAGSDAFYRQLRARLGANSPLLRSGVVQVWVNGDLACGSGVCRGCEIQTRRGPRLRCQDGPFMNLDELDV
ncbi:MAG: iron-sulfur cluster-binding protein [Anaerolineae bacterium]